jgi:hypothetical protein
MFSRTVSGCLARLIKRSLQYFAAITAAARSVISGARSARTLSNSRPAIPTFTNEAVVFFSNRAAARRPRRPC